MKRLSVYSGQRNKTFLTGKGTTLRLPNPDYVKIKFDFIDGNSIFYLSRLYMFFPWSSPDRESFKNDSVRWSSGGSGGQHQKGHPRLHQLLAYALWSAKRYISDGCHLFTNSNLFMIKKHFDHNRWHNTFGLSFGSKR